MNLINEGKSASNGNYRFLKDKKFVRKVASVSPFPLSMIELDLRRVEDKLVALIEQRGGALKGPAEVMFRNGGKRLRPALVLLSSRLLSEAPEAALQIAAAVEMVHGASLIHDDVIDTTDQRRGRPTLNAITGNRVAVLLGDFLLCQSLMAVAELDRVVLIQVVSKAVADMTTGQILELRQQGNFATSIEDYLSIVEGKTAALMEACCRLGALLSSASEVQIQAVSDFGRHLGMAFQITDDILDLWGSAEALGKPVGSDLKDKKYTLPFLYAYQASDPAERDKIEGLIDEADPASLDIPQLVEWMESKNSRELAEELAQHHIDQARVQLDLFPHSLAREALAGLLDYIVARQS
jgi:geranylgeranyl pyrophosphate synthase